MQSDIVISNWLPVQWPFFFNSSLWNTKDVNSSKIWSLMKSFSIFNHKVIILVQSYQPLLNDMLFWLFSKIIDCYFTWDYQKYNTFNQLLNGQLNDNQLVITNCKKVFQFWIFLWISFYAAFLIIKCCFHFKTSLNLLV